MSTLATPSEFDRLLEWAEGKLDDGSLETACAQGEAQMRGAQLLASRINANRLARLARRIENVEDELLGRVDQMDVQTLMRLRDSFDREIAAASTRIHNPAQQRVSVAPSVQVNQVSVGSSGSTGGLSHAQPHALSSQSRSRVASFVKGMQSLNARDRGLRIVEATAESGNESS